MDVRRTMIEQRSADHVSQRTARAPFGRKGTARGKQAKKRMLHPYALCVSFKLA
jgi:hypothetical protein